MTPKTRFIILFCAVLLTVSLIAYAQYVKSQKLSGGTAGINDLLVSSQIGGGFELINHDGDTVTDKDYSDKFKLIYFGFTYCPTICPTELQKMLLALEEIDSAHISKIYPIFVSVDPERDTPDVLKEYVALFSPNLIGLTGSQEQIDAIKKTYKVYASKVKTDEMSDYTVDHSSFTYLMSPDNKLIGIFKINDDATKMGAEITRIINAYEAAS